MSVINTNITSLIGQHNLSKSQSALQTSMERLSSGLRINSAKDDAAGQAIANRMSAQITGLNQAQRNANDGISIAQTAEGSLNQVNDNLQRIRELTVQAQNSTNSAADLTSIQEEINQRLDEINRISDETAFNSVKVLAEDQGLTIQVGANDGETITVNLKEITAATLNLSNFDVRNSIASDSLTAVGANLVEAQDAVDPTTVALKLPEGSTATYSYFVDEDGGLYAENAEGDAFEAAYNADTNTITVDLDTPVASPAPAANQHGFIATVDGEPTLIEMSQLADATVDDGSTASYTFHVHTETGAYVLYDADSELTYAATVDAEGNVTRGADITATLDVEANPADFGAATHTLTIPGQDAVAELAANLTSVNAELEGTNTLMRADDGSLFIKNESADGKVSWYSATADEDSGEVTLGAAANNVDPLASLDAALNQVDTLRSELGAVQNRFEDAINNLRTNSTNLSAARSRIEDADYAVEVANMTRAQILQQAGTSVLAQANQIPQIALSLLG